MSFQYNFPAIIEADNTLVRQYNKILEEVAEFQRAWAMINTARVDEEAMDIMHACETYFRIRERQGVDVENIRQQVENKNRNRGYYGNNI